jgi:hypothetical protein
LVVGIDLADALAEGAPTLRLERLGSAAEADVTGAAEPED